MNNGYDKYLEHQYRWSGDFMNAIFDAIARADEGNLAKLAAGFPEEVDAYKLWTRVGVQALADKCSPDHPLMRQLKDEYGLEA